MSTDSVSAIDPNIHSLHEAVDAAKERLSAVRKDLDSFLYAIGDSVYFTETISAWSEKRMFKGIHKVVDQPFVNDNCVNVFIATLKSLLKACKRLESHVRFANGNLKLHGTVLSHAHLIKTLQVDALSVAELHRLFITSRMDLFSVDMTKDEVAQS